MSRLNYSQYFKASCLVVLLVSLLTTLCLAQDASNKRGFQPGNSFAIGDFETINTTNGNLMLRFPLGTLPAGRNGLSAGITLNYNSKLYDSETQWFVDDNESCEMIGEAGDAILVCPYYQKSVLKESAEGGWQFNTMYSLKLLDRHDQFANVPVEKQPTCWNPNWQAYNPGYYEMRYHYKLMLVMPDGSSHEMRPNGWSDGNFNDPLGDWFEIRPDGLYNDCVNGNQWHTNTITYYSIDGSFLRLDVQHDGNTAGAWTDNPWTLYFPDGSKVTHNQPNNEPQRFYDRNNNYVELLGSSVRDQFNRSVNVSNTTENGLPVWTVTSQGVGQTLTWTIYWKWISVLKNYWPCAQSLFCPPEVQQQEPYGLPRLVVDRITMPAEAGGLTYQFQYNAPDHVPGQPLQSSLGWGEISGITLPSGAQVNYQWAQDGTQPINFTPDILKNAPTSKAVTYNQEYDGSSTPVTETWTYVFDGGGFSSITAPDGGVTENHFVDTGGTFWNSGLTFRTVAADGIRTETIWERNNLSSNASANPYPKTVFTSIKNAAGTYVKTAIKDYQYDKNGNVTRIAEYDWVNYGDVPRSFGLPTGIPAISPTRVTVSTYHNSTPDATQPAGSNTNVYWSSGSPRVTNAIASTEIRKLVNGVEQAVTRSEYTYDNTAAPANLTQVRSWDSTKGVYSHPLTTGNSLTATTQYNQYGMPTLMTDARGLKALTTYGQIGTAVDLYPTEIKAAYQTAQERTETREYHLATGLVTKITDADNNISTTTTFDPLGRQTLVKAAAGEAEETRTAYEYADAARRVITRSDLITTGDGKLVSIQHYDQLGRVRLSRQLEDASHNAIDETTGIKVQTRYRFSGANSYVVVSNPYRAATSSAATAETTMGWTRSKSDNAGRTLEVQTFGGAGLPAPWHTNTTSTGTVTTAYDANFTTVADQTQKQRRSATDALGRLIRVDEPDPGGNLGSTTTPNQPTHYTYDVLGNLTRVTQSDGTTTQQRDFVYSSLSRLTQATNPESGTINYVYDESGNLAVRTDARLVSTHYSYDALNRLTRRWYNQSTLTSATTHNQPALPSSVGATDEIKFYYDLQALPSGAPFTSGTAKGRLVAQTYGTGSTGDYFVYDKLGRVTSKYQRTGSSNYLTQAEYNRASAITLLTYPSGNAVTHTFDPAGRLAGVAGNLGTGGAPRTYSTGIIYSPGGSMSKEQFGTNTAIYDKLFYNSRGQLAEIRASTSYTGPTDYSADRGAIVNNYSGQCTGICAGSSMPDNNGNLKKQEIHIPGHTTRWQQYAYDSLNRLEWVEEGLSGGNPLWKQQYSYDRWGNRRIHANTYGAGINNKAFDKEDATNRLYASGDLALPDNQRQMRYDAAGNLIHDVYTGAGNRNYNGENKITSAWGGNNQAQLYAYDGGGQRIRRTVNGVETWQVYGLAGELLAEYPANGAAASPQKEYGYRNGQLLITATAPTSTDRSLGVNGTSAYVQVSNSSSLNITGAITVEAWIKLNSIGTYQHVASRETFGVSGTGGGYELTVNNLGKLRFDVYHSHNTYTPVIGTTVLSTGVWHHVAGVFDGSQLRVYANGVLDASVSTGNGPASGTSSLKIGRNSDGNYFNGLIDEVRVSNATLYSSNFTPQMHLTASGNTKGLWKFDSESVADASGNGNNGSLQSGAGYSADVPTGPAYHSLSVNGTSGYVQVPNSSSLNITGAITVEAWIKPNSIGAYQHVVSRETFGVAGTGGGYDLSLNNLSKLRLDLYHTHNTYTPVTGNTVLTTGQWHHVAGVFDGSHLRLYVNGVLDASITHGIGPASGTSSLKIGRNSGGNYFNGLINEVRVSNAVIYSTNFTPQTHLSATGSTKGLWKFDGQNTADTSGNSNNGTLQNATYSNDVPSGNGGGGSGGMPTQLHWLVSDHLGTPRMIFDQTGDLANMSRHDYLPFGEELFTAGGRSTAQGYMGSDNVRQQFTQYERDNETGLDYAQARYFANVQGRFTGVDPLMSSAKPPMPQSWNRYAYCLNNPLLFIDPTGLEWYEKKGSNQPEWFDKNPGDDYEKVTKFIYQAVDGTWIVLDAGSNKWWGGYATLQDAVSGGSVFTDPVRNLDYLFKQIKSDFNRFINDPLGRGGLGDPAFMMLGAPGPLSQFGSISNAAKEGTTTLYRAVLQNELDDIAAAGAYRLPQGQAEVKGFFSSAEEAAGFARKMFQRAPGEGTYTITSTTVPNSFLRGNQWQHIAGEGNAMFLRTMPSGPVKVFNFGPNPNFKFWEP